MTPDAPELATRWPGPRPPDDDCPVLRLADGTLLSRPATRDIAERPRPADAARASPNTTP